MSTRRILTALTIAFSVTACTDQSPLEVEDMAMDQTQSTLADAGAAFSMNPKHAGFLSNIPVTGTLTGGAFEGLLSMGQRDLSGHGYCSAAPHDLRIAQLQIRQARQVLPDAHGPDLRGRAADRGDGRPAGHHRPEDGAARAARE
jgi:hypothetical protein